MTEIIPCPRCGFERELNVNNEGEALAWASKCFCAKHDHRTVSAIKLTRQLMKMDAVDYVRAMNVFNSIYSPLRNEYKDEVLKSINHLENTNEITDSGSN